MEMTVKECVLKAIIAHYPHVKNHLIHNACPQHPYSSGQRLRELRKLGVIYSFDVKTNIYDFSETSLKKLQDLLNKQPQKLQRRQKAGEDEKGGVEKLNSFNEQSSHPSPANTDYDFSERGLIPENKEAGNPSRFIGCFEIKDGRLF